MELQDKNGNYLVSKSEYDFLQECKKNLPHIKNNWFSLGRTLDVLCKKIQPPANPPAKGQV